MRTEHHGMRRMVVAYVCKHTLYDFVRTHVHSHRPDVSYSARQGGCGLGLRNRPAWSGPKANGSC